MTVLTVANLKGGVGKTTTAVLLALGLAASQPDVPALLVDTDLQRSALKWARLATRLGRWPANLEVVSWTDHRLLERQLTTARGRHGNVVVDTPPSRTRDTKHGPEADTMRAALMGTGYLLVTTSPSRIDLAEIGDTFEVASSVDSVRVLYASVLLCRVWHSTRSATEARATLTGEYGYPVMVSSIPMREDIAQCYGTAPDLTGSFAAYRDALVEIRADQAIQEA